MLEILLNLESEANFEIPFQECSDEECYNSAAAPGAVFCHKDDQPVLGIGVAPLYYSLQLFVNVCCSGRLGRSSLLRCNLVAGAVRA